MDPSDIVLDLLNSIVDILAVRIYAIILGNSRCEEVILLLFQATFDIDATS